MINFIIIAVLVLADQGLKYLATLYLANSAPITVIPHFLGLNYVLNAGAGFSILSGKVNLLIVVTSVALAAIAYFIFTKRFTDKWEEFSFVLILAGGLGNLIDRVVNGVVVDYLEFLFIDFPIFNFADILICCGVALFAFNVLRTEFSKKGNNKNV